MNFFKSIFNKFQNQEENKEDQNFSRQNQQLLKNKKFLLAQQTEKSILQNIAGLQVDKDIFIKNIQITDNKGENQWIHTTISYNEKLNNHNLITLHGYAGSGLTYYKMIKKLNEKYNVYCTDIIGSGLSSRPDINVTEPQQIIDYFVDTIEQLRINLGLKTISLAGHSFGGYITAMYAIKYPQNIDKLILISPAGMLKVNDQETQILEQQFLQNANFMRKFVYKKIKDKFTHGSGITSLYQSFFMPSQFFLNKYLNERLEMPQIESQYWKTYLDSILTLPFSSDNTFGKLFSFPRIAAYIPLEEQLPLHLKTKVHFYYGQYDWMDPQSAINLIHDNKVNGTFKYIDQADHQIVFQNPIQLSEEINSL